MSGCRHYWKYGLRQIYRFTLYSRNEVRSHVTADARRLSSGVTLEIKVGRRHSTAIRTQTMNIRVCMALEIGQPRCSW